MSRRRSERWRDSIAIIGMSGRFPGAENLTEFWQNLRRGRESISYYSAQELAAAGVDPAALDHPNFVNAGSILKDIELFDAGFFGFTPRETESLDPQKRLFLECAWQALEDAAYDPERYAGAIGAYAGCAMSSYLYQLERNQELVDLLGVIQVLIGNDKDYLTTLVSYKLDLKGPSLSIQTTCSTSLVAVCVACQALLNYECDMALAGGVCVRVPQKTGYYYEPGSIYSPDGHCRVFDAQAQGVVFGNGVGVVVLKRLQDALQDGDAVHAIIRGAAINNDGARKTSYSAPGVDGQVEVLAKAQRMAGVRPETISYIEAHGTGTPVGDPVEIAALTKVFGPSRPDEPKFCAVGSVKTNFGHLDHAAGIAGLIKTVLCLKHKMLVPSLHFETANPSIDFAHSPFYVNTQAAKWSPRSLPRRAGVSAFGIGGTNAHMVVEEAKAARSSKSLRPVHLLLVSAKTRSALDNTTVAIGQHLARNRRLNLADAAYTTQIGRKQFPYRRVVVARNNEEVVSALSAAHGAPRVHTSEQPAARRSVCFMFSGQGAQYVQMGRELYATEPTFRRHFDQCAELLANHCGLELTRVVYPPAAEAEAMAEVLKQTSSTQPALFTIEYALAQLWLEWGVRPRGMIGHSVGEYVAACLSGVLSLADALRLVAERGRLMQSLPPGSMLAVPLAEDEARALLAGQLSIAAVNEVSMCVVSGPTEEIEQLAADLAAKGLDTRRLHTSHAFHSSMMDPILDEFRARVARLRLKAPQIPFVSNSTGTWITAAQATDPDYWVQHLRGAVRFADGLATLLNDAHGILLEVGPGQTLSSFARRHPARAGNQLVLSSLRHPHETKPDVEFILTTLGKMWLAGVELDWTGFHAHERRRRVHLPTYCFDRQRYWAEAASTHAERTATTVLAKRPDLSDWFYTPSWRYTVAPELAAPVSLSAETNWLVFDDGYLGPALAELLEGPDVTIIKVRPGTAFAQLETHAYEIDPANPQHYAELFRQLQLAGYFPNRIAHLWGISTDDPRELEPATFERQQHLGLYSVLYTAQGLIAQDAAAQVDLAVVTSGLHAVVGEEQLSPGRATVLAAVKTIPQEYPEWRCRNIDIVLPAPDGAGSQPAQLAAELLAELVTDSADTVVAYRAGQRWVQFFEPVRLTESVESTSLLRDGGVYLITGGLGHIGLALAEELARSVPARLVLIGRMGLPPRRQWTSWLLNRGDDDLTCRRIRKVLALESLGAEVLVISADVTDASALRSVVERTVAMFGEIHGVIHAAGTIAADTFLPIRQTDPALCEHHFGPKVRGALALEKALRGQSLDFWLMVSSLSSVLAGIGFTGYAAANIFLDSLVAARNWADGSPWISVNWDAWESPDETDHSSEVPSASSITVKEGMETFRRILCWGALQQVVVSASDLQRRIEQWITPRTLAPADETEQEPDSSTLYARPNMLGPYVAPSSKLEQSIAALWQEVLGVDRIGVHDNFFTELNGSSLLATQLVARLRNRFRTDLPVRQFFEAPTVAQIALALQANGGELKVDLL